MQVSVIIVNYNTKQLTLDCIESIYKHTCDVDFEIIVVDNASSDGSVEVIEREFPEVKMVPSDTNLGFGRANNLGAKYAKGEFLFLLNSDTLLVENTLLYLLDFMKEAEKSIGACGVSLLNGEQKITVSAGNFPSLLQEFSEVGFKYLYKKYYDNNLSLAFSIVEDGQNVKRVDYICGADIFIRKYVFEELNGFDEDYFMYFEETDLFFRLKNKGYSSVVLSNHNIIHLEGGSTTATKENKFNIVKYQMYMDSKKIYYKKNKNSISLFFVKIINTLFVCIHPVYRGNRNKVYKIIWK